MFLRVLDESTERSRLHVDIDVSDTYESIATFRPEPCAKNRISLYLRYGVFFHRLLFVSSSRAEKVPSFRGCSIIREFSRFCFPRFSRCFAGFTKHHSFVSSLKPTRVSTAFPLATAILTRIISKEEVRFGFLSDLPRATSKTVRKQPSSSHHLSANDSALFFKAAFASSSSSSSSSTSSSSSPLHLLLPFVSFKYATRGVAGKSKRSLRVWSPVR